MDDLKMEIHLLPVCINITTYTSKRILNAIKRKYNDLLVYSEEIACILHHISYQNNCIVVRLMLDI